MKDRRELVGVAFIERVEIVLDHGLDSGTVVIHGFTPRSVSIGLGLGASGNRGLAYTTNASSRLEIAQIALAAILTIKASRAVLNMNEITPCAVTVRRMVLSVMPTSETCAVMPITNEK